MAEGTLLTFLKSYSPFLLLSLLIFSLFRSKYQAYLSNIPGPAIAAYTKFWRLYNVWQGQAHWTSIKLHRRYGKLVRIAPNVVSVGDADEIAHIYNIKGDFAKTGFYPIQAISWKKVPQMNLFSTRSEAEHREQRKKVANAYSLDSLLRLEDAVDGCGKLFLRKMQDYADQGQPVDLGAWLQYYAFDVVGEFTFESRLGFLEKGTDVEGMMQAIQGMLVYAALCGQVPEMHRWLLGNPLLAKVMPAMEHWDQVVMFTLNAVNQRTRMNKGGELELEGGTVGHDMLSNWAAVKSMDPLKMSTRDIIVHLSTNVFAGSDTTAIALRAILYHLMLNPNKMETLQQEIDTADKAGKLSNPIQDEEARNHLPYLNAVLKETMRMHSSVGLILERHVPPGGATICGKYIPAGTIVGVNPWVLQYDAQVFPEPESFKPERWLDATKEELVDMEKHFFSFGAGSRVCIGQNISMIEMRKVIPLLVREFDMSIEGGKEWTVKNMWFTQQEMPPVILKRRR